MMYYIAGVLTGIVLTVTTPKVFTWGQSLVARYKLWRAMNKKP